VDRHRVCALLLKRAVSLFGTRASFVSHTQFFLRTLECFPQGCKRLWVRNAFKHPLCRFQVHVCLCTAGEQYLQPSLHVRQDMVGEEIYGRWVRQARYRFSLSCLSTPLSVSQQKRVNSPECLLPSASSAKFCYEVQITTAEYVEHHLFASSFSFPMRPCSEILDCISDL
jgi:hypothetical protein